MFTHCRYKIYFNLIAILSMMFVHGSAIADIAVIVNPANNSTLDKSAIKKLFMGKAKKFANGDIALPMNAPKGSPTRKNFNKKALGRSSSQINAYWAKLTFTGKGKMPRELSSDAEIIATIASNQGAISYVDASSVTDAVKVIATFK